MAGKGGPNAAKRNRFGKCSIAVLGPGELIRRENLYGMTDLLSSYMYILFLGPMAEWNQAALVALQGSLKTNVKMIQLCDLLERPAGGFMDRAEVLSVKAKTGDMEQMGEVINILRGKEDAAFYIFCDLLRRSNYGVWAQELASAAEGLKTEQGKFTVFNFFLGVAESSYMYYVDMHGC